MFRFQVFGAFKVGDCPRYLENPNNCARGFVVCDLDISRLFLAWSDVACGSVAAGCLIVPI